MNKSQTGLIIALAMLFPTLSFMNTNQAAPGLKEQEITYTSEGKNFRGFVVYDENITGKRPAILVIPEWWGMKRELEPRGEALIAEHNAK